MKTEYLKLDFNDRKSIQAFSKPYVKGVLLQSGFAKMLYFAHRDHCDFLLCAFLENVTPTGKHAKCGQLIQIGNILCFDNTRETRLLKAGVVLEAEADFKWIMQEHGKVNNPVALESITVPSPTSTYCKLQPNHRIQGI